MIRLIDHKAFGNTLRKLGLLEGIIFGIIVCSILCEISFANEKVKKNELLQNKEKLSCR